MKLSRAVVLLGASLVAPFAAAAVAAGCGGHGPNAYAEDGALPDGAIRSADGAIIFPGDDGGFSLLNDSSTSFADEGGHSADAPPDVVDDGSCVAGDAGPPLYPQKCAPATANECAGPTDT